MSLGLKGERPFNTHRPIVEIDSELFANELLSECSALGHVEFVNNRGVTERVVFSEMLSEIMDNTLERAILARFPSVTQEFLDDYIAMPREDCLFTVAMKGECLSALSMNSFSRSPFQKLVHDVFMNAFDMIANRSSIEKTLRRSP